jgi:hypothetical protein
MGMKRFRKFALLLMICICTIVVPSALAQDTFGLTDADFAYWTSAVETSAAFNTISYDYTFRVDVSGLDPSGDITIWVGGSGQIGEQDGAPAFSMTAVGELISGSETLPIDMEVRFVGDSIYLNLGDGSGWIGGPAEELLSGFGDMLGGALPFDPEALAEGDMSGMEDMMAMPGMMDAMMALSTLQPSDFIAMSREMDMSGKAHFVINFLIADLLTSDAFAPLLAMGLAQGMGAETSGMTQQEMQQMSMMVGMLFSDLTLTYEQFISTSTNLVERGVLTLNFPLPAMLTGGANASINLEMAVDLSGYNEPISVKAPETFQSMM